MRALLREFSRDEEGQDLTEYTIVLAFIVMAKAATMIGGGK